MAFYSWEEPPPQTKAQIDRLVDEVTSQLAGNLTGIYLHGSLAMGCFNPLRSDIDLLVVTRQRLKVARKRLLVESLLRESASPHPLEISFLQLWDINPWQYPTPYELHYSEDWREKFTQPQSLDAWVQSDTKQQTDKDLAAHITVIKDRGKCLWGEPIDQVFPEVPAEDFADSITSDLDWAMEKLDAIPVYAVLNACRIWGYFKEGKLFSKAEGARWALENVPVEFQQVIQVALDAYRSPDLDPELPNGRTAHSFIVAVSDKIGAIVDACD